MRAAAQTPYGTLQASSPASAFPPVARQPTGYEFASSGNADAESLKPAHMKNVRRRARVSFPVCVGLIVPWVIFSIVFVAFSLLLAVQPGIAYLIMITGFLLVLGYLVLWIDDMNREPDDPQKGQQWVKTVFFNVCFVWILAVVLGHLNYYLVMAPAMELSLLGSRTDVNPGTAKGMSNMDAGVISFINGSRVDANYSMGFKDPKGGVFCVAPIVPPDDLRQQWWGSPTAFKSRVHDFWAIGHNCCSPQGGPEGFDCIKREFAEKSSRVRMSQDQAKFYKLALQQVESAYGIKAVTPIFLKWGDNPELKAQFLREKVAANTIFGVVGVFIFEIFLGMVIMTMTMFAKPPGAAN